MSVPHRGWVLQLRKPVEPQGGTRLQNIRGWRVSWEYGRTRALCVPRRPDKRKFPQVVPIEVARHRLKAGPGNYVGRAALAFRRLLAGSMRRMGMAHG